MEKVLYLEKRGCNFTADSKEINLSDLENFRLFGYFETEKKITTNKSDKIFMVEISTSYFSKHYNHEVPKNSILSFFNVSFNNDIGECFGYYPNGYDCKISDYALINKSTKKDILEYLNNNYGTDYTQLEIVENIPDEILQKVEDQERKQQINCDLNYYKKQLEKELKRIDNLKGAKKDFIKHWFEKAILKKAELESKIKELQEKLGA
jgi:hypothetical protein